MMMQLPDTKPGFYYVTVYRCNNNAGIGGEHRLLRGPFVNDHAKALTAVDEAVRQACDLDPRAQWYSFGTARMEEDHGPGILDKLK